MVCQVIVNGGIDGGSFFKLRAALAFQFKGVVHVKTATGRFWTRFAQGQISKAVFRGLHELNLTLSGLGHHLDKTPFHQTLFPIRKMLTALVG